MKRTRLIFLLHLSIKKIIKAYPQHEILSYRYQLWTTTPQTDEQIQGLNSLRGRVSKPKPTSSHPDIVSLDHLKLNLLDTIL